MEKSPEILSDSQIPKYKQIEKLLISDIQAGIYKQGERIPSINRTSEEYLIARDTVERAYKRLKRKGILKSIPGKGYFVCKTDFSNTIKICLLFNKLSNYKKETYDGFAKMLGATAFLDLHVYNYNLKIFERIIIDHLDEYDYFVIIPHFLPGVIGVEDIIRKIPSEKVLIIDKKINLLLNEYPTVYQDFEEDIINALESGKELLRKYKQLNLVYPQSRYFSKEILMGFTQFCKTFDFNYSIIDVIQDVEIEKDNAYVIISDEDLAAFIKEARRLNYKLGEDVGVISYNENPIKELLEGGITTISTNHVKIGEAAAQMLIDRRNEKIRIPFEFKNRNSL